MPEIEWGIEEKRATAELLRLAWAEDLGSTGDITSRTILSALIQGRAAFIARQSGTIAGLPILDDVFSSPPPNPPPQGGRARVGGHVEKLAEDGMSLAAGTKLALVHGPMHNILAGERIALNFLQRLSGIATQTKLYSDQLIGTKCKLLDTRKTTPGWRILEKYAVRCGGGHNHRMGLFDAVMIKDNHIAALRHNGTTITEALAKVRTTLDKTVTVEVEVENLSQLREVLPAHPDMVLLDNMTLDMLREAVHLRNELAPHVRLEASGGINLTTIRDVAFTGVDCISVGALTHSAPALDIALDYDQ